MNTYLMNKEIRPETKARLEMAHTWLLKLDDPDVTQQTLDEFERWIKESPRNKDIFDQAVTLRDAFLCLDDDDFDIQVHAPTLAEKLTDFTDYLSSLFSYHKWQIASFSLAAFFVLLSVITLLSNPDVTTEPEVMVSTNTYETGIGETEEFLLSDGTSMTVGAASKVNAIFREGTRTVELVAGSVYVDVARDAHRPFSVKTGNLTVTALGTAFDVQQSPHQHRVSVAEGKVEVFYDVSMQDIPISKTTKTQLYAGQA
ncbi:MAG: FecR domain-containing protein, partial [Pseudomonadota bacterium]